MHVAFVDRPNRPEHLVCEAEVIFDEPGPLRNMKLVGFCVWRSPDGELYVTFPSRALGAGPERKYFDLLRATDGDAANVKAVKSWIIAEYTRSRRIGGDPVSPVDERAPRSPRREGEDG